MSLQLAASLDERGVYFETVPSKVSPEDVCFLICAADWSQVDMALSELLTEYPTVAVQGPLMAPDGWWTVFGRVPK